MTPTARAIRRPRANATHHHLFVRGKGDVERDPDPGSDARGVLAREETACPPRSPSRVS